MHAACRAYAAGDVAPAAGCENEAVGWRRKHVVARGSKSASRRLWRGSACRIRAAALISRAIKKWRAISRGLRPIKHRKLPPFIGYSVLLSGHQSSCSSRFAGVVIHQVSAHFRIHSASCAATSAEARPCRKTAKARKRRRFRRAVRKQAAAEMRMACSCC